MNASTPTSVTVLNASQSRTVRSSAQPNSASQPSSRGSRSQSRLGNVAGLPLTATAPPPPFPTFTCPVEERIGQATTPSGAPLSAFTSWQRRWQPQSSSSPQDWYAENGNYADGMLASREEAAKARQDGWLGQPQLRAEPLKPLYTPFTLKKRCEVEDVYTACFLTTLQEEILDNELTISFKNSIAKVASPFSRIRSEALREALQQILSIAMCATVEAQEGQSIDVAARSKPTRTTTASGAGADGLAGDAGAGGAGSGASPDAALSLPRSPSIQSQSLGATPQQQQQHQQQQGGSSALPPSSGALLAPDDAFLVPFDAIRATMASVASASAVGPSNAPPYRSETWSRAQRALATADFTSVLFRRLLAPRNDVRAAMNMGGPVMVELTTEEALHWSSRRPPVELSPLEKLKLESKMAMMAKAGGGDRQRLVQQQPGTADDDGYIMTPCGFKVAVPERPVYTQLTDITYSEQELALRLLQGMCLTVNYQRRCIADGCFFHYATEVFQCFLQHVEALFTQRRLTQLSLLYASSPSPTTRATNGHVNAAASPTGNNINNSVYLNTPIALGSGTFSPVNTLDTHCGSGFPGSNTAPLSLSNLPSVVVVPGALRQQPGRESASLTSPLDSSPVAVEEGQVAVIIALIDAIEAACHYSPTCLTRFVQTGGVAAMLNLMYSPFVPAGVRAAVLDTTSVLMQEVAPFRRAVATPAPAPATTDARARAESSDAQQQRDAAGNAGGGRTNEMDVEDTLLAIMLEQAATGSFNYPGAEQSGDPPPFMMDRASASKFESAVREWFSKHGISHVMTGVVHLRGLGDWRRLRLVQQQQALTAASAGAGNAVDGGGSGAAASGATAMHGGSIETTRARQRARDQRATNISALLQAIDGKRADLQ